MGEDYNVLLWMSAYMCGKCLARHRTLFPLQVLLLITFIAASVAQDKASDFDDYAGAAAAAGWVIFVGIFAFIYEFFFLVCRLLNFSFMGIYRTIVFIVVSWCMCSGTVSTFSL